MGLTNENITMKRALIILLICLWGGSAAWAELGSEFERAAAASGVPAEVLKAVAYVESRGSMRPGVASLDSAYGVMGLRPDRLCWAATLMGVPAERLKENEEDNIQGAALVLRSLKTGRGGALEDWAGALAEYGPGTTPEAKQIYVEQVFRVLSQGLNEGKIAFSPHAVSWPRLGLFPSLLSQDYPPALWVPANSNNYTVSDRPNTYPINYVIMHTVQGSYAGCISWFQNPNAQVSAHYVMRSSDGEITQMVRHKDVAWHAGNWNYNTWSIGIEHEGWVDENGWYTDTLFFSSSAFTRYACNLYGIPRTRSRIIGHSEVPGATHTDPGPLWDWPYYMALVNGPTWADTTVEELTRSFVRSGPYRSWWFAPDTGYSGHMWWTYSATTADTNFGTWTPDLPRAGTYEVFAFIPNYHAGALARYQVHHQGGVTTRVVDQAQYSNIWVSLGTYSFGTGQGGYVYLGDATGTSGQQIGFDAVRWHYLGTGVEGEPGSARITGETHLNPLAPNPLREGAEVSFSLGPPSGNVSLGVYDVSGRKIRSLCEGYQPAGEHRIFWDGRDDRGQRVPGGVFFLRLSAGGKELTQRAVVLR